MSDDRAGPQPPEARRGLPPLRIHHLLLLTTSMAVLLSVSREWAQRGGAASQTNTFVWTLAHAASLTVVVLGCFWSRRRLPFPSQPGHGLAVLSVMNTLLTAHYVAGSALGRLYLPEDQIWFGGYGWFMAGPQVLLLLVAAAVALRMRRSLANHHGWRWVFLLSGLGALIFAARIVVFVLSRDSYSFYSLAWLIFYASIAQVAAALLAKTIAVVVDLRRATTRHWSHWFIIVTSFASSIGWLVGHLHYLVFGREM